MDSEKSEKIFDIDGYLGKEPEETPAEPEKAPVDSETAGEMGAEAVDVANKTAIDPVQLKYRRNRVIVALVLGGALLIAGIFVLIDQIDKNNFRERSRDTYNATLATLADSEKAFNNAFKEYSYGVFGLNGAPTSDDIYPDDDGLAEAKLACLDRFGIGFGELTLLDSRNEERDDYVEANDDLNRIATSYTKATSSLDDCRKDILEPVVRAFGIEYGKISFEDAASGFKVLMPSKIGYTGPRKIESVTLSFALYNKGDTIVANSRGYLEHKFDSTINAAKKLDFDPFLVETDSGAIARQTISRADRTKFENATLGVYSIFGKFQAK